MNQSQYATIGFRPETTEDAVTLRAPTRKKSSAEGGASPRPRETPTKTTHERPRAARRATADRRAQLLELGLATFGTSAYDDVSIDAIAQAAGISKGLLYHYFPTKRAFYAACVKASAEQFLAFIQPPAGRPALERLNIGLEAYLTFVRARGPAFTTLMRSGVGVDEEIARIVDAARMACLDMLTHGFEPIPALLVGDAPNDDLLASPAVRIALRGWIGFAEAMSIAWVEALSDEGDGSESLPSQSAVRELLASALVQTVTSALAMRR